MTKEIVTLIVCILCTAIYIKCVFDEKNKRGKTDKNIYLLCAAVWGLGAIIITIKIILIIVGII